MALTAQQEQQAIAFAKGLGYQLTKQGMYWTAVRTEQPLMGTDGFTYWRDFTARTALLSAHRACFPNASAAEFEVLRRAVPRKASWWQRLLAKL